MKFTVICAMLALATTSYAKDTITAIHTAGKEMVRESEQLQFSRRTLDCRYLAGNDSPLEAAFTLIGAEGGEETVWSENFDNGTDGWTLNDTESFAWELKTMEDDHAFTAIDPDDKQSLFIEGAFMMFERGTASAISPQISIPDNATFNGYVGYSYNLSIDYCTLTIFVSQDGEEWTRLWSCLDDTEDKQWRWHAFSIDMTPYAGETVQFKFEYGNSESYDNAGYMGDFAIDGLQLNAASGITSVDVMTGETLRFADASTGKPTTWQWNFPGGTPSESTEQYPTVYYTRDGSYDVSLTVGDGTTTSTKTMTGFVNVTGVAPTAKILPPATFRYSQTRLPMIAPLATVQYSDASVGFPTEWQWTFTGTAEDALTTTSSSKQNPEVNYMFQHEQSVMLTAGNEHGSSDDILTVSVEYEGYANNLQPEDQLFTFDLGDGYGEFPGTNYLGITEYAEKFSKPSRPIFVAGVNVYFTQASTMEVLDQIADVKVALCKSENGLPGEELDFASWRVFELEMPVGSTLTGTYFEFSKPLIIDDEFFIVVSGIPEKNETCTVSFATAMFRAEGNTAYFMQDGVWKAASDYFPAGSNHTSYAISPYIVHSVMSPLSADGITVGKQAGKASFEIFSYFGYSTPVDCDADWCRVVSKPNGLTVDTLTVAYDQMPENMSTRTATLTLTDGASTMQLHLTQDISSSAVEIETSRTTVYPSVFSTQLQISLPDDAALVEMFGISGTPVYRQAVTGQTVLTVDGTRFAPGAYIVRVTTASGGQSMAKAIKR